MITVPPGWQTPPDEPAILPCTNPEDCAYVNDMIASNRWNEWDVTVRKHFSSGNVRITGYTPEIVYARMMGKHGAAPLPGFHIAGQKNSDAPVNWVTIHARPTWPDT